MTWRREGGEVRSWGRLCPNAPNPFCTSACPSPSDSPKWGKTAYRSERDHWYTPGSLQGAIYRVSEINGTPPSKYQSPSLILNSRPPHPNFATLCTNFHLDQPPNTWQTPIHLLKPTWNKLSPGIPQPLKIEILWIWLPFSNSIIQMTKAGSLLPKCLMRASGRMIKTLTMMIRRFPFKNQSLRRQANIMTNCLPKKTVKQTLIEDSQTGFCTQSGEMSWPLQVVTGTNGTTGMTETARQIIRLSATHCQRDIAGNTHLAGQTVSSDLKWTYSQMGKQQPTTARFTVSNTRYQTQSESWPWYV